MPQDILGEESKDQVIPSKCKLVQCVRGLDARMKRKTVEISQDLPMHLISNNACISDMI